MFGYLILYDKYEKYADDSIYPLNTFTEISDFCKSRNIRLWQFFFIRLPIIPPAASARVICKSENPRSSCIYLRTDGTTPHAPHVGAAAMRAINALSLANFLADTRKISFDIIVKTMYNTGKDLLNSYKETSSGGL